MPFRLQRSFKVAPGVRVNFSKTGIGASIGSKYARCTVHSSGRRTVSGAGGIIPGVRYQKSVGGSGRRPSAAARRRPSGPVAPPHPQAPGLFAHKYEKDFYKAVQSGDPAVFETAAAEHPEIAAAAEAIAGLLYLGKGQNDQAGRTLQAAYDSGADPSAEPLVRRWVNPEFGIILLIAPGVSAEIPLGRDLVGLALAEIKQSKGDVEGAIEVVEHLEPSHYAAVSLADLYHQADRHADVIEVTEMISNTDNASCLLCVYRAAALRQSGHPEAALQALKEALKSKARDDSVLLLGRLERARTYSQLGKLSFARRDLEAVIAKDSTFPGAHELALALAPGADSP